MNVYKVYAIFSGSPAGAAAGNICGISIFSSRMGAEMFRVIDSGCVQHQAQPITLTDLAAALVGRLIFRLSATATGHNYICEHGHTHYLTLLTRERNVAPVPPRFGVTGNPALNH
jgi:hypothetical protein